MDQQRLLDLAREAAQAAYAPHSGIRVGAAIFTAGGRVFPGCNVENSSYGLTICAERNAAARAICDGVREFQRIAIWNSSAEIFTPCGACRQFLFEFAPRLELVMASALGEVSYALLSDLLPLGFRLEKP